MSGSHIYVSWLVLPFQSKKYFGQNIFLPQMSWYRNYFISIVANNGKEQIKHKTWVLSKFFLLFRKMFQRSFTNSNAAKTERMTLSFQPKDSKTRQELIMNIFPKISRQIYKEGKMCLKKINTQSSTSSPL